MLAIWCPNTVRLQLKPLRVESEHSHLVQIGGRRAHVASGHNGSGNTRETFHGTPYPLTQLYRGRGSITQNRIFINTQY